MKPPLLKQEAKGPSLLCLFIYMFSSFKRSGSTQILVLIVDLNPDFPDKSQWVTINGQLFIRGQCCEAAAHPADRR